MFKPTLGALIQQQGADLQVVVGAAAALAVIQRQQQVELQIQRMHYTVVVWVAQVCQMSFKRGLHNITEAVAVVARIQTLIRVLW
jgi:hypothetical protein